MSKTFIVKKIRSSIGCSKTQRATLEALGLRKINSTIRMADHPANRGQILKVAHLVDVSIERTK